MAGSDNFKKFLGKAVNFFEDLAEKIKKTDRRLIIMIAAAAVLLIVMLALIINGITSNKEKEEPSTEPPVIVQEAEKTTDDSDIAVLSSGKYKVDTDGLNLRPSANTDYAPITQIPKDTVVTVLFIDDSQVKSSSDYGWAYVEYNGQRGWVSMEYLVKQ